jgi:hypothetical protein
MSVVVGQTFWQYINNFILGENAPGGGNTICKSGGIIWIVAPNTSEVSRLWNSRDDAVTTATACTGSTGWFVPTVGQLQNPGYTCRTYWDSYSSAVYWSSTETNSNVACCVDFSLGYSGDLLKGYGNSCCVRAFRCVTY